MKQWLVLESFITPSVFSATGNGEIVDEWTFCQYQDRSTAESALHRHWDTFVTEDDFAQIAGEPSAMRLIDRRLMNQLQD
jgi:glucan 1,3-beta-glucosidase